MRKVGSIPVNCSHFLVSPLIRTRSLCTHACTYIGGTIMTRVLPDALFLSLLTFELSKLQSHLLHCSNRRMFTNISITALVLLPFFTPALSICPRLEEYRRLWTLGEVQAYNQDQTCSICLFITNETIVYAFSKPIQPPPVIVTLFESEVLITIAGDTFGQSLCPMHGVLATVSTLPIRLL